jgi:uncharacterized membrane protein
MAQRRRTTAKRRSPSLAAPSPAKRTAAAVPTPPASAATSGDTEPADQVGTLAGPGRGFPWLLIVAGGLGVLASFTLIVDRIALWKNPDAQLSCSLSETVDCTGVMLSPQSEILGFPNPLLGLPMFAVVVTIGIALLAHARFAGWFWILLALSQVVSAALVAWFIFQTLFRIQLLCPWCSLVWLVTVPLLFYTVAYALAEAFPHARSVRRFGRFLLRWQVAALVILYAPVVFAIVYEAFLT